ncbi:MAG: hypothetical protein AABZ60_18620 [Planctomycetota bacterium]
MISLEKCKEILNRDGEHYSEEEIRRIREALYKLGNAAYELYEQSTQGQESHSVQPCLIG